MTIKQRLTTSFIYLTLEHFSGHLQCFNLPASWPYSPTDDMSHDSDVDRIYLRVDGAMAGRWVSLVSVHDRGSLLDVNVVLFSFVPVFLSG